MKSDRRLSSGRLHTLTLGQVGVKVRQLNCSICNSIAFVGLFLVLSYQITSDRGCYAKEFQWRSQIHEIDGPRQNLLEQVEQLIATEQIEPAIELLQRLEDESDGRLVLVSESSPSDPFPASRYISLQQYCNRIRLSWAKVNPQALAAYRKLIDPSAKKALDEVRKHHRIQDAKFACDRYIASSYGDRLLLELGDLYLESGATEAARRTFQRILPESRIVVEEEPRVVGRSISSSRLLTLQGSGDDRPAKLNHWLNEHPNSFQQNGLADSQIPKADLWSRLIWCSLQQGDLQRARLEAELLKIRYPSARSEQNGKRLWEEVIASWFAYQTNGAVANSSGNNSDATLADDFPSKSLGLFGGNPRRGAILNSPATVVDWPRWQHSLDRWTSTGDRMPGGPPRLSEMEDGVLAYYPVVHQSRVYLNDLRRIWAFELESGKSWPVSNPTLPLYDSGQTTETIIPVGYPMAGVPRGTVAIADQQLYARLGSSVTGWMAPPIGASSSQSMLVGLDLAREGRMLDGFPIQLSGKEWDGCEFEGCPLPIGDDLFVMITQRNGLQCRRFVACFDRWNAKLRWRTPAISSGAIEGTTDANLISHQMLSYDGGYIYCNTGLGVVAAIDRYRGQIEWALRYQRSEMQDSGYPTPQRFRYRDMTPCLVHRDLVICAPSDCPEILAIDADTGDLVWATSPEHSADVAHLLVADGENLIAAGDRVVWFDVATGSMRCSWPEGIAARPNEGLPSPRGLGRGFASKDRIYFPVRQKIVSLSRTLERGPRGYFVPNVQQIDLASRAAEGGNLVATDHWWIIATPSRLVGYCDLETAKPNSTP